MSYDPNQPPPPPDSPDFSVPPPPAPLSGPDPLEAAPGYAPPPPQPAYTPPPQAQPAWQPTSANLDSPPYGAGKLSASDDKLMCVLLHALPLVVSFLAPLIIWLIKKDESRAVDLHGKESLNFHITMVLFIVATCGFGAFLAGPAMLILGIIASIKASEGTLYRYPVCWRLVK